MKACISDGMIVGRGQGKRQPLTSQNHVTIYPDHSQSQHLPSMPIKFSWRPIRINNYDSVGKSGKEIKIVFMILICTVAKAQTCLHNFYTKVVPQIVYM